MKLLIDIPENTYEQIKGLVLPDNATVCDIEQIRAEIEEYKSTIDNAISEDELKIEGMQEAYNDCLEVIDKYTE